MSDTNTNNDALTTQVGAVFGQLGQDPSDPVVAQHIATTVQNLRAANPDAKDEDILNKLKTNLPQVIAQVGPGSPLQTPTRVNGSQLQDMAAKANEQRQADTETAMARQRFLPAVQAPTGPVQARDENFVNSAFIPSNSLAAQLKTAQEARAGDLEAIGKSIGNTGAFEDVQQKQVKTVQDKIALATTQMANDPKSPVSVAAVTNAQAALRRAGAPEQVVQSLSGMSAAQAIQTTNNYKESLGAGQAQAILDKGLQEVKLTAAQTAAQIAQEGLLKAQTGEANTRSQGQRIQNEMLGRESQVQQRALNPYLTGQGGGSGLENAPGGYFEKYGTPGQKASFANNSKTLDGLTGSAKDRDDTLAIIRQSIDEVRKAPYTGLGAQYPALVNENLQKIAKNLASIESKAQLSQSSAAGAAATAAATPDVTKQRGTLLSYLYNLQGQLERQQVLQQQLEQARQKGTLASTDIGYNVQSNRSYVNPQTGDVKTLPAGTGSDVDKGLLSQGYTPLK